MKVSSDRKENSEVVLEVEMEPDELEEAMDKAYQSLVQKVKIAGFRKGKAPRAILERQVGREALREEALTNLIPETYNKVLEEQHIEAIDQPKVELTQLEPVIFRATVPVRPTIKLGDYRSIRIEPEEAEVKEEDLETTLEFLREQQVIWEPVDRPVNFGDMVTLNIEGQGMEEPITSRQDYSYKVIEGAPAPLPGFAEEIVGIEKDEEKEFKLVYPSDYSVAELADKEFTFKVTATEVKERRLPELDDELAKSLGLGCDTMDSLRQKLQADLQMRAESAARQRFQDKAMEAAVTQAELEYPLILVEREIDQMLNERAQYFQDGHRGLENYLQSNNKTMEELRDEIRPIATKRVMQSLVLSQIAKEEGLEVASDEIDAEVKNMVKDAGESTEDMLKFFTLPTARISLEQSLMVRKTVTRLTDIARGEVQQDDGSPQSADTNEQL